MMKNKGLGSILCLVAAVVALVTGIVFLATQESAAPLGHTGIMPGVVLLAGAAAAVVFFLIPVRFGALVQTVIYNVALYLVVLQLYFVFADVINNVTYAGGNAGLCVMYMAGTLLACVISLVACFFPQSTGEGSGMVKELVTAVATGLVVAIVCVVVSGMGGANPAGPAGPGGTVAEGGDTQAEHFQLKQAENSFAGKTVEELAAIPWETWIAKEPNGEVAYFFEGQYTEGFGDIQDPGCLDMYCCKDGSMYGTFSGPSTSVAGGGISHVFGWWYNIDENDEYNFVIHLAGTQDVGGWPIATNTDAGADADIFIFDTDHGAYNWEASLSYGLWGGMMTRNINIYGQEYAKAKSLTVNNSALRTFYTGDELDPTELKFVAIRANGSEEKIWNGRVTYSDYDSSTPGTKTVTAYFLGTSTTFEVKVDPLVTETYTGSYDLVMGGNPTTSDVTMLVDYSHGVITVSSGMTSISGTVVEKTAGGIRMTLNGSEPFEATLSGGQLTIPAHTEVSQDSSNPGSWEIPAATLNLG